MHVLKVIIESSCKIVPSIFYLDSVLNGLAKKVLLINLNMFISIPNR